VEQGLVIVEMVVAVWLQLAQLHTVQAAVVEVLLVQGLMVEMVLLV
jgi:hypothetical protein